MKRIGISILIFILTCLFCVFLYLCFNPPLIKPATPFQSFTEVIKFSKKWQLIASFISLVLALAAKLLIFVISCCIRVFPVQEEHANYYPKIKKSLQWIQWGLNGLVLVKIMSLLINWISCDHQWRIEKIKQSVLRCNYEKLSNLFINNPENLCRSNSINATICDYFVWNFRCCWFILAKD